MRITVREATAEDVATVHKIDRAHSPVFLRTGSYEKLLEPSGLLVLAAQHGRVRGFAACSSVLDEGTLLNLAVLPEARGQGIARLLLEELFDRLRGRGVLRLLLEVRESNGVARALYGAAGFEQDGRRENYYSTTDGGASEAAILMNRKLG